MHARLETILRRGVGCCHPRAPGGYRRACELPLVVLFEWEGGDGTPTLDDSRCAWSASAGRAGSLLTVGEQNAEQGLWDSGRRASAGSRASAFLGFPGPQGDCGGGQF